MYLKNIFKIFLRGIITGTNSFGRDEFVKSLEYIDSNYKLELDTNIKTLKMISTKWKMLASYYDRCNKSSSLDELIELIKTINADFKNLLLEEVAVMRLLGSELVK